MIFRLLALAAELAGPLGPGPIARMHVVADAMIVAHTEPPLFAVDNEERTAALLIELSWREARWEHNVVGFDAPSLGSTQVLNPGRWLGVTDAEVLASRRLGFRAGLAVLRYHRDQCGGTLVRWLGAFASGRCGLAEDVGRARCEVAGICDAR